MELEKDPKIIKKIMVIQDFLNNANKDFKKLLEIDNPTIQNEIKYMEKKFKSVRTTFLEILEFFGAIIDKPKESKPLSALDLMSLFDVPDEMRKTLTTLIRLGPSDIEKISERTKRDAELEKGFVLVLQKMGYIEKLNKDGKELFKAVFGKKKSKISDEIWRVLVKDSSEMMTYICKMELEKGELKKMDFDEIQKRVPHVKEELQQIKSSLDEYLLTLKSVLKKYNV
ncbi:MAG: hypothetical protein ACTSX4_09395 [Candidatus Helarchaeota archaeon]